MTIKKKPWYPPPCDYGACWANPTHRLVDDNGTEIGCYCEEHADQQLEALTRYADAVRDCSTGENSK